MKTILWKEIRQWGWCSAAGMAIMFLVAFYTLGRSQLIFDESNELPTYASLVAGVFAFVLGILQFRGDSVPAARALLLHRCIQPAGVYWGKLIAGVTIFLTAMLPAFGFLMLRFWIDDRETIAARPGVVLPSVICALVAFSLWAAAAFVVHNRARFIGSRLLPVICMAIGLAGLSIASRISNNLLSWPLLFIVPCLAMGYLSKSAFVNNRISDGGPRVALWMVNTVPLLLGFISAAGVFFNSGYSGHRYHVTFGNDTAPWLVEQTIGVGRHRIRTAPMSTEGSVRDRLQSQEGVRVDEYFHVVNWGNRSTEQPMVHLTRFTGPEPESETFEVIFDNREEEILVYRNQGFGNRLLRTVGSDSLPMGRIVSFEMLADPGHTHVPVRFYASPATSQTHDAATLIACENGLFVLDPECRSVEMLTEFTAGTDIGRLMPSVSNRSDSVNYVIRAGDECFLISSLFADGKFDFGSIESRGVQIPGPLREFDSFYLTRSQDRDGEFVAIGHATENALKETDVLWLQFADDGTTSETVVYREIIGTDLGSTLALSPASIVPAGVFAVIGISDAVFSKKPRFISQTIEIVRAEPTHLAWAFAYSTAGVLFALAVARRRRIPRGTKGWWCLGGALFGPCSALAMLSVYPRISRHRCANCGKATSVKESRCQCCGADDDERSNLGIEIMDDRPSREAVAAT